MVEQTKEDVFEKLDFAIFKLLNDKEHSSNVTIFLQANHTTLIDLHRKSGIGRYFLKKAYDKAQIELKKEIYG